MRAPALRFSSLAFKLYWMLASRLVPSVPWNPLPGSVSSQSSVHDSGGRPFVSTPHFGGTRPHRGITSATGRSRARISPRRIFSHFSPQSIWRARSHADGSDGSIRGIGSGGCLGRVVRMERQHSLDCCPTLPRGCTNNPRQSTLLHGSAGLIRGSLV